MPVKSLSVKVQQEDFSLQQEMQHFTGDDTSIGAIASFIGICRDENGRLSGLELEHYPGMAEAEIGRIAEQAMARFDVIQMSVIHRYGLIKPGEQIVMVLASATHREAAFDSVYFVMDFLKTDAPFWKKEHLISGETGGWVEAVQKDDAAKLRWSK